MCQQRPTVCHSATCLHICSVNMLTWNVLIAILCLLATNGTTNGASLSNDALLAHSSHDVRLLVDPAYGTPLQHTVIPTKENDCQELLNKVLQLVCSDLEHQNYPHYRQGETICFV